MPHYGCARGPDRTEKCRPCRENLCRISPSATPVVRVMTATSDPVDLAALRRAAAPVVAWYEQFLAGEPMPLAELDHALVELRALLPIGGRLGRALAVVATGGRDATTEETVAAFEFLRHSAGLRHIPPPPPTAARPGAAPSRRRRGRPWTQPPLPGIEAR